MKDVRLMLLLRTLHKTDEVCGTFSCFVHYAYNVRAVLITKFP